MHFGEMILDDGAKIMFLILWGGALMVCLGYQVLAVPFRYSLDYGEAPLVDQAMRLASGQNIYRADLSTPRLLGNMERNPAMAYMGAYDVRHRRWDHAGVLPGRSRRGEDPRCGSVSGFDRRVWE